ncbi:alpha-ketoglutarate-dependent dioxygenase AlkB [Acidisoma cellulosilytica]|uniref:Alpha-ketoglutarate-dependent dioxygenase AlkB n=2 Tax=Acidisoma cellulosilyticum TaxID=2802395 RepID=A0A963YZN3_9PROT|nr:alpha-ketoglutarate-dependent dioxygenase AlkB [Acidisoma cellulosilyticum]
MVLLRRWADPATLLALIQALAEQAPFRFMTTRRGGKLAAAMTSAGASGWVSDARGYRYESRDPLTGQSWPAMPDAFLVLADTAAAEAGFPGFAPDTCLINRYAVRAGMGLHRDGDERDFDQPIVSVSLGLPAVFLVGGMEKDEKPFSVGLESGDVLVFGGPARLLFHGIRPVKPGDDPLFGPFRYNLTFRRAR